MDRVAITGCGGFIGRSLQDFLENLGISVIPIFRYVDEVPNLNWLRETKKLLVEADWLIHAAWRGTRKPARFDPQTQKSNEDYAKVLGVLCQETNLSKIIGMGSQDEFGLTPPPWADDSPTAPTSAYAQAKLNVRGVFEGTGIPTLWLRLFSVIGPGDTHEWIFTDAVAATLSGRRLQVGPCDNQWSFTHVADVCNAVFLLAFSGRRGPFCVTAPFFAPLRQYLEEVSIILNMDSVIDFDLNGPQGRELGAVPSGLLDLGWSPKFSFEQSVLDYAKWLSQSTSMSAR